MARKVNATKSKSTKRSAGKAKAAAGTVVAWQDDPLSKLPTIQLPVPNLAKPPLKLRIKDTAVKPGIYDTGTPQFRYWNAAAAWGGVPVSGRLCSASPAGSPAQCCR